MSSDTDKIKIKLKPHQETVVKYMSDPSKKGLILYHSTGSGKTITSIMSMLQHPEQIVIIGKKSSKKAFRDDLKKIGVDFDLDLTDSDKDSDPNNRIITEPRYLFFTFSKMKKILQDNLALLAEKSVIIDEAHNLRNETTHNLMLINAANLAKRVMLLTATPVINYINDLSVLVNLVKDSPILPTDIDSFNAAYYNSQTKTIENPDILVKKLSNCISYYDHYKNSVDYPSTSTEYIDVEMNYEQLMEYKNYIKKYFYDVQLEYRGMGKGEYFVDFGELHSRKKNFFLSSTRQLSNTLDGKTDFPKIQEMYKMILEQKKKNLVPMIIYSNFLENGVYTLAKLLERSDISYKTITGNSTDEKINFVVNDYNKRKIDILMITSAGSESLDLKNTRVIHIMEPHWNESRIKQVIGRAVRYKSHSDLPESERNVKIVRWASVFPNTILNKSADGYLIELSKTKDDIFKVFDQIIQDASIENNNMKKYIKMKRISMTSGQNDNDNVKKHKIRKNTQQKGGAIHTIYLYNKYRYMDLKNR